MFLQIFDQRLAVCGVLNAGKDHFGAWHELFGVGQIDIERLLVPSVTGVLIGRGIGEAGDAAGLAVDDTGQSWSNLVFPRFERVANRTILLEHDLASLFGADTGR